MMDEGDTELVAIDVALLTADERIAADLEVLAGISLLAGKAVNYFLWGYILIALYTAALGRVEPLLPIDTFFVLMGSPLVSLFFATVYGVSAGYKGRHFGW